jgi:acyl-CoA synthetase (AMP-forming)/AMP-acid ligase II
MSIAHLLERDFVFIPDLIADHAAARPDHPALILGDLVVSFGELDRLMDRVAAALQRDGIEAGEAIAICASTSIEYASTFLGALRAGVVVAPLAPSSTPESLAGMALDSEARLFFLDGAVDEALSHLQIPARRIRLDRPAFAEWLAPDEARPAGIEVAPEHPCNIIYSSGTTGAPKGIVQSHRMRWWHVRRGRYGPEAITLTSTPLYSNTTLVSFFPTLAHGGTVVLMAKFEVERFLELAQQHRATHAMLVPVQYKRIMEYPRFGDYDLSSFVLKYCTSAPFPAELKGDVLKRWPGGLIEVFGMTEGGGSCMLIAHEHPDKLHTVGRPAPGHDIRLIDEEGREVGPGEVGEVVGSSPLIMNGYHKLPAKTAEAEWYDPAGKRFMRTGDVARFDEDGFLVLMDRKKDMIISGGFNIYPSDLEAVLKEHPAVAEAAVVGAPSDRWGETPVGFVVLHPGSAATAEEIRAFANARLGKTQRLADLQVLPSLPRSHIGKVLKRELREAYRGPVEA